MVLIKIIMFLPILDIGFKNYIAARSIILILNPKSKPARRIIIAAKENNKLVSISGRKAGRGLILLKNGEVVLSAISSKTLKKRYMDFAKELNSENKGTFIEPLIDIGFENYILYYSILGIYTPNIKSIKHIVQNAKDNNKLFDCSQGRRKKSIIILTDSIVVLSVLDTEIIEKRYMKYIKDIINKKEIEEEKVISGSGFYELH